jgi:UDP-glucose 4-epimerase
MLAAASGVTRSAEHGPAKPGEQRRSCLDTTGTRERLGWSATIRFDEGVRSTVEYFRTAG